MTRAITALVALFAVKLQACTAFQHSKVQSNRAMNAAPPVRLDWSSAKSATPEIGRFTTKTSRALADAGAGTKVELERDSDARHAQTIVDRGKRARRRIDVGDHSMERYVKHAKTWVEAAKVGVADVE